MSSVSNALDYQARRSNIRFKNAEGKNEFVHTLNGSGLATSRLFPAILEQFQTAEGTVIVPEALRKFLPEDLWELKKKYGYEKSLLFRGLFDKLDNNY